MSTVGRILIVDDNKTSLAKIGMAVRSLGYDAFKVDSGSVALRQVCTGEFDVIANKQEEHSNDKY
jgi:CheY-like chemotaxis protein